MKLNIYTLRSDVRLPEYKTLDAACMDLYTPLSPGQEVDYYNEYNEKKVCRVGDDSILRIPPLARVKIPMGIIMEILPRCSVRIHTRSSVAYKKGLVLANQEAVIDADFREELQLLIRNTTLSTVEVENGERLAQAEVMEVTRCYLGVLKERPERVGDRTGGVGSTGN